MRRDAESIDAAMVGTEPTEGDEPIECGLRMRGQLVQYAGTLDHRIAQHASLYEMLLRMKARHDGSSTRRRDRSGRSWV